MPVNNPFALVAGLQYVDGTPSSATSFTGTVAMGFNGTDLVGLRMDASDNLLVNVAAFSGTVAVTQSTTPWIVAGNLTHNSAAPTTNNVGVLPAVASSGAPTYNTGDQVLLSTDLAGNLRVSVASVVASNNITEWASTLLGIPTVWGTAPATSDVVIGANAELFVGQNAVSATNPVPISATAAANASGNPIFVETVSGSTTAVTGTVAVTQSTSPWVVSLTSTTITGTVAVTQSTSPWVVNLTQVAGTTLGATAITNFGTAPAAAAVPGVNASLFSGTTALTNTGGALNVSAAQSGTWTVQPGNTPNTTPWLMSISQGGNTASVTAKGTQGSEALTVQNLIDSGRTYLVFYLDAVTGITAEALASMTINKGGSTSSATTYTVTAGKTLRLQSISTSVQETNSTVQTSKVRVRSAGTVTATSPVVVGTFVGTTGVTNEIGFAQQAVPDGLEIAAGQEIGISHLESSTSSNVTVTLVGFEY